MAKHSQNNKVFTVILPDSTRHTISLYNFGVYLHLGLIRSSKANVGRLSKWLRAYPDKDGLHFEVVKPTTADPHALRAVHFLWLRIMSLAAPGS